MSAALLSYGALRRLVREFASPQGLSERLIADAARRELRVREEGDEESVIAELEEEVAELEEENGELQKSLRDVVAELAALRETIERDKAQGIAINRELE